MRLELYFCDVVATVAAVRKQSVVSCLDLKH